MTSGTKDQTGTRERDSRRDWDNTRARNEDRRGGTPPPRSGQYGGYRDRDREGYRSPGYESRSRSRSPQRDRSPYYGGPPSREIMMDGLPLDMVEEDVGLPPNFNHLQI